MSDTPNQPNIDQRLDRLVERHEAMAESLELLTADMHTMQDNLHTMQNNLQAVMNTMQVTDARERVGRHAIIEAIRAYIQALDTNGEGQH